ncbi:MAG: hypothetical protein ACREN6_15885 [Gemmatimonadaceae bacterium]
MMRRPLALAALVLLAACDIPTAAPRWDMTWNVPSQNTTLSVNTFLPSGVTTNAGNTAFVVNVNNVIVTQTLGGDCALCGPVNGLTVPKPAFVGVGNGTAALPASVTAATLPSVGDTLSLTVTNGLNFDPIKPTALAAGDTGWVVTTIKSGATVIGKDSINGQTTAIGKNGATITRKIVLSGSVTAAGVTVNVTVDSPLGDPVTVNTAQTISFTASVGTLQVSSATVDLGAATTVTPGTPTTVDLSGIDNSIAKNVNSGFFILTVTNPLGVAGNLTADFTGGAGAVSKALTLSSAATSTDTLNFSNADLKNMLGYSLQLTFSGTVSGTSVTITPGQTLAVTSRLQINVATASNQ